MKRFFDSIGSKIYPIPEFHSLGCRACLDHRPRDEVVLGGVHEWRLPLVQLMVYYISMKTQVLV